MAEYLVKVYAPGTPNQPVVWVVSGKVAAVVMSGRTVLVASAELPAALDRVLDTGDG